MDAVKDIELLKEIKDRFREAYDAANPDYTEAVEDLEFAYTPGAQWSTKIKTERIQDGRPCFEINKIPYFIDQVIGDIRQNEPSIKIKPVDSRADPKTAEILTGLIRNIEVQSDAETAYDTAVESAVACGYGAYRITTQYAGDDQFDQDIIFLRIKNPFTIYWDPSAQKWDKSDARYGFITEKMPIDDFKREHPKASTMSFEGSKDRNIMWGDDKTVRVVEYFKKEIVDKILYLMKNTQGQLFSTFMEPDMERLPEFGWELVKKREIKTHQVKWCKATQAEILEEMTDWPGKYIPIIMVYGKEVNIEGKTKYRGMVRYAKDSQRLYNMFRTTGAEIISLTPKSPYLVTAKMIEKYQTKWDTAHKKNYPYLPYEPDPINPQAIPHRAEPIMASSGIAQEIQVADQEMHDTLGLQQASLGQKSNEKSGRAILARQKEGDTAQYPYYDNLGRSMKYAARVLIDLIPKIYDTARIIRIMNEDGSGESVPINQSFTEQGQKGEAIQRIYDLTVGKYDAMVSIGPSYTTQREEAAQNMLAFIAAVPEAGVLLGDLLAKNLDWPGAQEIERRLKVLLPPQLQGGNGQPAAPQPPNPAEVVKMRGEAAKVQGQELENEAKFNEIQAMKSGQMPVKGAK